MAFSFLGCSKNATSKFLEDYRVTDLGNGSCRVEWYMAMEVNGFSRHIMFLTRPIMRIANRTMDLDLSGDVKLVRSADAADAGQDRLREAVALLDRAATRNLVHPNRVARIKSGLARHVQALAS